MQSKWKRVGQRVSSAKRWLAKAEEEFSRERPARGELNLMLAEAELKRLKESEPSVRRTWLHQGAALVVAVAMIGAVSGTWWFLRAPTTADQGALPPTVSTAAQMGQSAALVAAPIANASSLPLPQTPVNVETTTAPSAGLEKQEIAENAPPEKTQVREQRPSVSVGMSEDEMRRLVRKAGQTLRGQQ